MAYVVPNSVAQFFVNTGLSPSHENSLYFASESAKDSYFTGLQRYNVTNVTYQRENRGYIRVELPVSSLIACDYMRFRNDSFENKWFYAFITEVNYINNITTEVRYVLDPLMTWMGTFNLKECYVERQHTRNDGIGNNICDEGLSLGNYVTPRIAYLEYLQPDAMSIRMALADGDQLKEYGNIATGCTTYDYSFLQLDALSDDIKKIIEANEKDSIVSLTMIPNTLSGSATYNENTISIEKPYHDIDGYVPKNNKLFTYPYCFCTVDNGEGATQDLMYEYFGTTPSTTSEGNMEFLVTECAYPSSAEILTIPLNYKGVQYNFEYRMAATHFPICSFSNDAYEAYLAQKNAYFQQNIAVQNAQMPGNAMNAGLQALAQGGTNFGTVGMSGLKSIASSLISDKHNINNDVRENLVMNAVRPETADVQNGTPSSDIMFTRFGKVISVYERCITRNYAQMIDDYFTMFGYAVKQVLTPNMNARPHWTYVKTIGCNVAGSFPASDARAIENIFDNGVRFWHNLNEMGDYSLDNSPS